MTKRPSIVSSFGGFAGPDTTPNRPAPTESQVRPPRVGAGVIGVTQRTLSDIRQERDDLRKQLASAGGARELSTDLIDPSPFPDRLTDATDAGFESLKRLIEEEGQKVAIQVRAHPASGDRFQIVFGHRRWRAAKDLGRPVKAEIVTATDEELAVAQGIENSARQDLTWIEKALFAWRLEEAGIKARCIRAALSVDDAELARFRSVCRALPQDIINLIGRAPRIGRPRWAELAKRVSEAGGVGAIRKTLSADKILRVPSDERFRVALAALTELKASPNAPLELSLPDGRSVGRLSTAKGEVRIAVDKEHAASFAAFMAREAAALIERFFASQGAD